MKHWYAALPLLVCCTTAVADLAIDIKGTSLAELMQIKITTLSRKQEPINRAAAAIYVLTGDEIKRLGVTHIAEALRYVPGVEVARLQANQWAISIRGFNSRSANKLLVMIDGRSIYSSLFSGVLWEEKDLLLDDVDRIEIVRGPGGALWGANAVNGVINIITKQAKDTVGGQVKVGAGVEEQALVQGRYGWQGGAGAAYSRVYAKALRRGRSVGMAVDDHGESRQVGFRHDRELAPGNTLNLQGDIYQVQIGPEFESIDQPGNEYYGGNLLLNWALKSSPANKHKVLAYYDNTALNLRGIIDRRHTLNIDYQMQHSARKQELVWGLGFREIDDRVETFPAGFVQPERRSDQLFSAFIQDQFTLGDNWRLTLGTKYEHNEYSGDEWQPSVRGAYTLSRGLLWAAWSHAVRTPTRLETDINYPAIPDFGEQFDSEKVNISQLGWRTWFDDRVQFEITAYRANYQNLLSIEPDGLRNEISGHGTGLELSASYQASKRWLLRGNLSSAQLDLAASSTSADAARAATSEDAMPNNQIQLMSLWDINPSWQFNAYLRYVSALKSLDVDSYLAADFSLGWQASDSLQLQLVGRHLGDSQHPEWNGMSGEVEQDLALYLSWEFN